MHILYMVFQQPTGICTDGTNLYICDTTHFVIARMPIANPYSYTIIAGSGSSTYADGIGTAASFRLPTGICYDSVRNCLYITDILSRTIRKLALSTYEVSTIAGVDETSAYLDSDPTDAAVTPLIEYAPQLTCDAANGYVYFTEQHSATIRRLELANGYITTIAGTPGTSGNETSPYFGAPIGIKFYNGILYIADSLNNAVRSVNISNPSVINTVVAISSGAPYDIYDVIPFNNIIFILNTGGSSILTCDLSGNSLTTLAGSTDRSSGYVNGTGSSARFHTPQFFCYVNSIIYISDTQNNSIRIMTLTGIVNNTVTGSLSASLESLWVAPPIAPNVSCFPTGTRIATSAGYRAVETLKTGDLVLTADNRQVPIKAYSFTVKTTTDTAPYKIPKNSLGPSMPVADLHLSPLHAFQLKKGLWHAPKYAAKQYSAIQQYDIGKEVTYYHFECPNYFTDNLIVDGCVVESYSGKQLAGIKHPYTYNKKLGGFTRASALARNVRQSN